MFDQCAAITGTGGRGAFTYIDTRADGRPDAGPWTGLALWILKTSGEPWLWSTRPEELRAFVDESGWTIAEDSARVSETLGIEFFGVALR